MNNEEKEAIEILKEFKKTGYLTLQYKYNKDRLGCRVMLENTIETVLNLIEKQQKEIEEIKKQINLDNEAEIALNNRIMDLEQEVSNKKEEIYSIAKTNYILGQTDERSQWYKKINEKIEDLQHNNNGDDYNLTNVINIIKELIGKEE